MTPMPDDMQRHEMMEAIRAGDARLRDHIDQSIARLALADNATDHQIQLALQAAEALELERIHRLEQRLDVAAEEREKSAAAVRATLELQIEALKREFMGTIDAKSELFAVVHESVETATAKSERNNELWRAQANAWREQSADRERSQAEQTAVLTATFLPREVADTQFTQLDARLRVLEAARSSGEGGRAAVERREDRTQPVALWAVGAGVTILLTAVVIVSNVLSSA